MVRDDPCRLVRQQAEENGCWFADVAAAHIGDEYRYHLTTPTGEFKRIEMDP